MRLIYAEDVKKRGDCYPPEIRRVVTNILQHTKTVKDVVPVRHGRWIHHGFGLPHGSDWIHCSECGKRGINTSIDLTNYCPNCGAKMEGVDDV